jgi:D-glycero-D-manno-heptose 1,7-bisphosphate phosphatase
MAMRRRGAIFLDKDGTLIEDLPYNVDPRRIRLAPGARDAIRLLAAAGHRFVIASNQSGVARGYFTEAELDEVRAHLEWVVEDLGGQLVGFYACPHLPEGINEFAIECDCRKPAPGLILRAAEELDIDLDASWFVGDTWMDAVAGRAAGCRTIMVGPDVATVDSLPPDRRPDATARDLLGAARIILQADEADADVSPPTRPRDAGRRRSRAVGSLAGGSLAGGSLAGSLAATSSGADR